MGPSRPVAPVVKKEKEPKDSKSEESSQVEKEMNDKKPIVKTEGNKDQETSTSQVYETLKL